MKIRKIPRFHKFAETVGLWIQTETPILNTHFSAQFDKYLLILSLSENKCKSKKQVQNPRNKCKSKKQVQNPRNKCQIQETSANPRNKCKSKKQVQNQEISAEIRNVYCFRHTTNFCRICAHPRFSERVKILMCLDADQKVPQVQ